MVDGVDTGTRLSRTRHAMYRISHYQRNQSLDLTAYTWHGVTNKTHIYKAVIFTFRVHSRYVPKEVIHGLGTVAVPRWRVISRPTSIPEQLQQISRHG